ncbi:MAG TPA: tRNA uridine-5-carboxymethylaminomethyl(34) synthesis GTPase MnmE [Rhizomicrobium sp.]|jgi:tRNA modification GTPase|nr:tRNA uridine-5-carboxymethylaminomethyl(34) synthesis GTPase MnmE [Rhizomicrobium sp.]
MTQPGQTGTIFALSSAPGRAGVAVIRVCGPAARAVATALTSAPLPPPRQAALRAFVDRTGAPIDQGLLLWFAAPASFSGEDMAEFHVHGGRAVTGSLLAAIAGVPGTRPAEPGEFTRRAVLNGKLDLTQAEAIGDLIDAETDAQRRQALRQYGGALADLYEGWRARLIKALAWAEAAIDFSDEDLPGDVTARSRAEIVEIIEEIQTHSMDSRCGEIIRDGLFLTVIGPPNAGKSSMINALARRDVAIVAETAGTTRDIIEVRLDIGGYAVIVADTAGLREAADAVESEGVRRALARAAQSDLVLLLLDGSAQDPLAGLPAGAADKADLVVWNKADLPAPAPRTGLRLSLKSGDGIDILLARLEELVAKRLDLAREAPVISRARHRHALAQAVAALTRAQAADKTELFAEDLRLAVRAIGRITGRVDVEELLDVVFRDFCIGK